MKHILLIIAGMIFLGAQLDAQATDSRWNVSVNSTQVAIGETLQVEFSISNSQASNFIPPDFKYFKVLGAPMRGSRTSNVNGRVSTSESWTYNIKPEKTGKFWIQPASINLNGTKVFTKRIQIEVLRAKVNNATTDEELTAALSEEVFIRAELSDSTAVIGQPLLYELKLYWIPNVYNVRLLAEPALNGFYREDNPRGTYRTYQNKIKGKQFKSKTLFRSVIYPQQIGDLEIGSYRIMIDVEDKNGPRRRSFFNQPSVNRIDLKSNGFTVRVDELPKPVPTNFSGAVGNLDIQCKVDQRVITTDDAVSLLVKITGEGDTKQMKAPIFSSTDSLEIYDPKLVDENSFQTPNGTTKEKSFEYVVLPKYPGKYQVSPKYSYFDAEQMEYVSLSCDTIELRVSQGSNPIGTTTYEAPVIKDGLSGIMLSHNENSMPSLKSMNRPLLWSMLSLPILSMFSMIGLFYYKKNQPEINPEVDRKNKAKAMALQKLSVAKTALDQNNPRQFYDELSKAMHGYLEDKIGIPLSSLSESFIREKLESLSLESDSVNGFMDILKNCQMALFAGKTGEGDLQKSYHEAGELIESLEDQLN